MGDETKIFGCLVVFWLVLSTGLFFYNSDPEMDDIKGFNFGINTSQPSTIDQTAGATDTGIVQFFKFLGTIGWMLTVFTPVFDNPLVTALTNIVLYTLRIVTGYIVYRMIRGGG